MADYHVVIARETKQSQGGGYILEPHLFPWLRTSPIPLSVDSLPRTRYGGEGE
jgi:hypothetical protein